LDISKELLKFVPANIFFNPLNVSIMNARQTAKLAMYRAIELLCNSNATITKKNAAFTAAFAIFVSKIAVLLGSQTVASKQTKGIVTDKKTLKKILAQNAADLAALVFSYATKEKNETLKQIVNYAMSDIEKLAAELVVPTCVNIKKAAEDNLAALADYGVTAAMLTDLQTDMDNFSGASPKPKVAKASKVTENANIKTTIKEIDTLLKDEMDKLLVNFKKDNPDFVSDYHNARVIIDPGSNGGNKKPPTDNKPK
jgi:hypothetical protein